MNAEINIEDMKERAKESDYNETYQIIEQNCDFRIGTGVRMKDLEESELFIEVVITLCEDGDEVILDLLREKIDLIAKLTDSGYEAKCDDDNSVTCEKMIELSEFEEELKGLKIELMKLEEKEVK